MPAPAIRLCVAAQAGSDRVAQVILGVFSSEFAGEFGAFGPRPDKAHLPTQDIPKLWKFIKTKPPQIMTDPRAAGIIRYRPDRAQVAFGIFPHGPEFDYRETPASKADAFLPIENGSAVCQTHSGGDQYQQGCEHDQSRDGNENIRRSLDPARPARDRLMLAEPRGRGVPVSCRSALR